MKVSIEDVSQVKKKILVELPAEDVKKVVDEAYKTLQKDANIHGFRKGKTPRKILEMHYGDHVKMDVTSKLIDDSYPDIVKDNNLKVTARPEIENISEIKDGGHFTYTALVEVRPDVKIEGYKDLNIKKQDVSVSDKEIDDAIELLRERHAIFKDAEDWKEAVDGSLVSVDFSGTMDDKPIEGADAQNYSFVIGSGTLLKGLESGVIGMKKGEEREIEVKFPEGYKNQGIAGRTGKFKVIIKELKDKILPDLNNEFAKDVDCENIAQLREKVQTDLKKYKERTENERLKKGIIKELIDKNRFEIPLSLAAHYHRYLFMQAGERLKQGIMAKEDVGLSKGQIEERYVKMAEDLVRHDIIVDAIAKEQGLDVSDNEIDAKIKELADDAKEPLEAFKSKIEEEGGLNYIKENLLENKVFDLLINN